MLVAENLRAALWRYDLAELDDHGGAVYGLTSDYRLAYLNETWFRFAAANGGEPAISRDWGLGRSVLDCIPDVLRPFYADIYGTCLISGRDSQHDYECSSATRYRLFHQHVVALDESAGLLIFNSLVVERAHDPIQRKPRSAVITAYTNQDGLVIQCVVCRRVKYPDEPDRWDWIPDWVNEFPPCTSHGLCPPCYRQRYPLAS